MVQYFEWYEKVFEELGRDPHVFLNRVMQDYREKGNYDRVMAGNRVLYACEDGAAVLYAIMTHQQSFGFELLVNVIAQAKNVPKQVRMEVLRTLLDHEDPEVGHSAVDALHHVRREP